MLFKSFELKFELLLMLVKTSFISSLKLSEKECLIEFPKEIKSEYVSSKST